MYDTVVSHIQGFHTCSWQHGKLMLKTSKWLEMLGQKLVTFCSFRIAVSPDSTHVTVLERKNEKKLFTILVRTKKEKNSQFVSALPIAELQFIEKVNGKAGMFICRYCCEGNLLELED